MIGSDIVIARRSLTGRTPGLIALAALVASIAAAAQAEPTAWAFNNKPGFTGSYQPEAKFSYNSAQGGKGKTLIRRATTGVYSVTFDNLGSKLPSNVQITAVGGKDFCTTSGWSLTGQKKNITVSVRCFTPAGTAADSGFTLLYVARSAPLGVSGPLAGFVLADKPKHGSAYAANPNYSYNSDYGANSIVRSGVGAYAVTMTSLPTVGGMPLVTARSRAPVHCQAYNWGANPLPDEQVIVQCFDKTGAPVDAEFSLLFTAAAAAGNGRGTDLGAFAYGSPPGSAFSEPAEAWEFNSLNNKPLKQRAIALGQYELAIPGPAKFATGIPLAGATEEPNTYCTIKRWSASPPAIFVNCYNPAGKLVPSYFDALFQASSAP